MLLLVWIGMISEYDIFHDLVRDMVIGKVKGFQEFMQTFEQFEINLCVHNLYYNYLITNSHCVSFII